ncbi:MAG: hypothetical protein M3459_07585 [Actinomycetota bacterium]|nr:hypothetical protein [Actinomycetota bacterium]
MISKLARFARSPQGQRMARKAMEKANDPKTRRQIDDARHKLARKRGGSSGSGTAPKRSELDPGA